jgi:hypothetical protein
LNLLGVHHDGMLLLYCTRDEQLRATTTAGQSAPNVTQCRLRSKGPLLVVTHPYTPTLSPGAVQPDPPSILVFLPHSTLHAVLPLRVQPLHQMLPMPRTRWLLLSNERQKRKSGCVTVSLHCRLHGAHIFPAPRSIAEQGPDHQNPN